MKNNILLVILLLCSWAIKSQAIALEVTLDNSVVTKKKVSPVLDGDTWYFKVLMPDLSSKSYESFYWRPRVKCRLWAADSYENSGSKEHPLGHDAQQYVMQLFESAQKIWGIYKGKDHWKRPLLDIYLVDDKGDVIYLYEDLKQRGLLTGKYEGPRKN